MKIRSETAGGTGRYQAPHSAAYLTRRDGGMGEMSTESEPRNGVSAADPVGGTKPRLPSLDLEEPVEPDFSDPGWLDSPAASIADHPLLRGLLLELPPKGTNPPPEWLDRWFEATRSILELLYVDER